MSEDFDRELLSQGHQVLAAAGLLVSAIRDNNLSDIEVRIAMARNALGVLAKSVADKAQTASPTPSPHDQREGTKASFDHQLRELQITTVPKGW